MPCRHFERCSTALHDIRSPRGLCPGGHTHATFLRELNLTVIDSSGGAMQDKDQASILSLKGGTMRASKTEAAVNYEDMISLHEVLQLLRELECLGFVKWIL